MPIITIYKCDHCGNARQGTDEDLYFVGIVCRSISDNPYPGSAPTLHERLWCLNCLITAGIKVPASRPGEEAQPEPATFEAMLREIIQDEISNQE